MSISHQLKHIESQIEAACLKSGRKRSDVRLLLATKTIPPEHLKEVAQLGYNLFGENKAQELNEKIGPLLQQKVHWHFIGHLQSNKVKDIIDHCEMIHSVDRLSLAAEISKKALAKNKVCPILIEVNTSNEENKSGTSPAHLLKLCQDIALLDGVKIMGLMTLAANTQDQKIVRGCFQLLKKLSQEIQQARIPSVTMKELSMGMSNDFSIAIEEGSTLIRLGSAVFGARS